MRLGAEKLILRFVDGELGEVPGMYLTCPKTGTPLYFNKAKPVTYVVGIETSGNRNQCNDTKHLHCCNFLALE
jgi:hypothetical protein